jgi:hypothetical protein
VGSRRLQHTHFIGKRRGCEPLRFIELLVVVFVIFSTLADSSISGHAE